MVVFSVGMVYLTLSMDWRGRRPPAPPVQTSSARGADGYVAGAARVDLRPEAFPVQVAGYGPPRSKATESGPLAARAVVLGSGQARVAIALAEVLEVPPGVARRVREHARAQGLTDAVVAATHTHSSFGGYDPHPLARVAATGSFSEASQDRLVAALSSAVTQAVAAVRPATLRVGLGQLGGITANRDTEGGYVDDSLTALALDDLQGGPIARVVVFGSHATLVPRRTTRLDGDWPGRAMEVLETKGGVALVLQGILGDTTSRPPEGDAEPADRMGRRIAQEASRLLEPAAPVTAPALAWSAVELGLPRGEADAAVPGFLRMPAANVLHAMAPRKADVAALRLPGVTLALGPAEPTAGAARLLREQLGPLLSPGDRLALVSLAQGYVGYAETPEAMRQGVGEAKRTLFGPELLERLRVGLSVALEAVRPPPAPATPEVSP